MFNDIRIFSEYGWLVMSDNDAMEEMTGRCKSEDIVFMQYTGLKDKNGKEIYSGDVVKAYYQDKGEYNFEVEYFEKGCMFVLKNAEAMIALTFEQVSSIEVIGNIYESQHD